MKLDAPFDCLLEVAAGTYRVVRGDVPCQFNAPFSTRGVAKLYTLACDHSLLYVGIAQQSMAGRLRDGFSATGKGGYWGYKWKDLERTLKLTVWTAKSDGQHVSLRELETVEAEVAFLCRQLSGQWPAFQHEIHFYPSAPSHRDAAAEIYTRAIA
jgi:hypothetical protein